MPAMTSQARHSYDVIVVGARCAGAATATLLARQGLRVLALDRHDYGADTLSTHALMRGGVVQLHRWGILPAIAAAGTPPITATTFHYGQEEVVVAIKPGGGVDALYAPRRTVLDRLLVDAAREAGVEVRYGRTVVDLLRSDDGRVRGVAARSSSGATESIGASLVIGADGLRSTIARLADAEIYRRGAYTTGAVYGYFEGLDRDRYRWYFGDKVAASMIPTNDGAACVIIQVPSERFAQEIRLDVQAGLHRVVAEVSPHFAGTMAGATQIGPLRAFAGARGFMRQSFGPGWALVGDAAYFKDPLTAHGITDAFRDAELLARAVTSSSPKAMRNYQIERDRLSDDVFAATDAIAAFDWDLDTIRPLHLQLNDAMKREVATIVGFDAPGQPIAA
jgi:2-polyprenyl-6-methoxyphenol hydroxylase-like FAD-dependent oxidoreductase